MKIKSYDGLLIDNKFINFKCPKIFTHLLKRFFVFFIVSLLCFCARVESFDKVVIWGHKLHSHTHSYIHNAFYIAFTHMGYKTFWLDSKDDVRNINFANTLFLTEGQVDDGIPIRDDCKYILHNCTSSKYKVIKAKNRIALQVYNSTIFQTPNLVKVAECIYYDLPGQCIYMPWATDLLPHEIDRVKQALPYVQVQKTVHWVGTIGDGTFGNINQLNPFIQACKENGVEFIKDPQLSVQENIKAILSSYMAPAIVGSWQIQAEYIPCRIFKNISYGKMGVTNSLKVYELFDKKIVYNPDTYQLFYDAKKRIESMSLDEMYELMDLVKTKHTYINRINTLLDFLDLVESASSNN